MPKRNAKSTALERPVQRIVSGGQTGVDRAGLDAALQVGLPIGGWCPRGRRSEKGLIPQRYPLRETVARSYAVRTEWNVRDSDGTLILVLDQVRGGTQLTLNIAREQQKPAMVVHLRPDRSASLFTDENSLNEQIDSVAQWLRDNRIRVLNVAGPRGSSHTDVYSEARQFVSLLLERVADTA